MNTFYEHCEDWERPATWCDLCGHPFGQKHRIKPGEWGGEYVDENVAMLCPNHHAAVHFLMAWYLRSLRRKAKGKHVLDEGRLLAYTADRPLWKFWGGTVKPVVIERLKAEGRWHPYIRSADLIETKPAGRPAGLARKTPDLRKGA